MLKKFKYKSLVAVALVTALIVTAFAPVVTADEAVPTIPDLYEYRYTTIDEIESETTVGDLIENTVLAEGEEADLYNSEGYLLLSNDYVGNNSTIIITKNNTITEVYKIKLYGDLNGDGRINALDSANLRAVVLGAAEAEDHIVADARGDGELDVLDLVRLQKEQVGIAQIPQNRMSAYSSRFAWLDTLNVPFTVNGYQEIFEDFAVVSNDIDLTFSRFYDSNGAESGMLSVGWTASFEGSCKPYENNSRIVKIYGQSPLVFDLVNGKYVCNYSRAKLTSANEEFVFIGEDGLTYTFNQSGYLVSIADKNSNTVTVTVDTNGKIQKVTDSIGREYTYTYNENGLLLGITDCIGRTVNYTYDSFNRLSSVTGVMGTVTEQYEYNSNNKLITVSDAFCNTLTSVCYEENSGVLLSVTDSENITTEYDYNQAYNSVTISQDDVSTEEYVYNRYNYLVSSNTEDGLQQIFYCNTYGDVAVTENADGSVVLYNYDVNGNPIRIVTETEEETAEEINRYDSNDNIVYSSTGTESTVYTYDNNGNTLSVTKTDEKGTESTEYTYFANGLVQSTTADGVTTQYSYDSNRYLSSETDTDGNTKSYSYNAIGWLESEISADSSVGYKYNLNGDTLRETKNGTVISRTVYDNYGRIKQQISEAEYNSDYDGLNSTPSVDSYLNNSEEVQAGVRYYYGTDGKLSQIKASCYTVATDSSQKVTSVTAGNTVLAEYNYTDDAKELLSSVDYANGQSISYSYDADGNITSLYYGDTLAYSYAYDDEGTLTSKTNLIEQVRTDYTEDNITVSRINADDILTEMYSYKHEYLVEMELPAGIVSSLDGGIYFVPDDIEDADLERITESFNGQSFSADYYEDYLTYGTVSQYTTKNDDDTVGKTQIKKGGSNILSSSYAYNESGLPEKLTIKQGSSNELVSSLYTYDDNGNITEIIKRWETDGLASGANGFIGGGSVAEAPDKRYYYDELGQLVRVDDSIANQTVEYIYNGTSGNIASVKTYALHEKDAALGTPISTKNFAYAQSGWTDLLTSVDGNILSYDNLGNLISYNGYTYTWEAGRRLTQMTNGTNTYSYKYDDNGIRKEKTINGVTTHYTTVDGRITGQYDGTNTIYFRYNAENSLIGFNLNGTEYFYLKNIQGDIEGILDLNGNLVVEYTYDVWGKVLSVTDTSNINLGMLNPMRYRDYYLDVETGYYYLQSRYYNSEFCRFINADEPILINSFIRENISLNIFMYCDNNPIITSDNSGYLSLKHFWNYVNALPLVPSITKFFGFAWDKQQGIWYSIMNPKQRNFGYCDLYDTLAPLAGIIIKHKKILFRYNGKEWALWLWKGQYGITTGAEIGLYVYSKTFKVKISGKTYSQKWYRCAYDSERIKMAFTLYKDGRKLFSRSYQTHWWLTGFKPGITMNNKSLSMYITLGFKSYTMAKAFSISYGLKVPNSSVVSFWW